MEVIQFMTIWHDSVILNGPQGFQLKSPNHRFLELVTVMVKCVRGDVKIPHSQIVQAAACGQQPYILEDPFTNALDGSWLLGGCSLHRVYGVD